MRTFAIAAVAAPALAAAVPRIELNLNSIAVEKLERHQDVGGTGQWSRFHAIKGTNARGVQDFTERCPAGTATNGATCPLPDAHAWDSLGKKEIAVQQQIYLVDDDGTTGVVEKAEVEYNKRRTYLIKYVASDAAGNKAEQLVFALILDDTKPPRISCDDWSTNGVICDCSIHSKLGGCEEQCSAGADYVIEAAAGFISHSLVSKPDWSLCKDWKAFDLVEGYKAQSTLAYKIESPLHKQPILETNSWTDVNAALTGGAGTKPLGTYTVVVTAHDHAGAYGAGDGSAGSTGNNVVEYKKTFVFVDKQAPVVTVLGDSPNHTHECGTKYEDAGATASDARDGAIVLGTTYANDKYTANAKHFTVSSTVDENKSGAYKVTFTANDASNNWAKGERFVLVKDTQAPKVVLVGDNEVTRYVQKDDVDRIEELGVSVNDDCDPLLSGQVFVKPQPGGATSPKVSMSWSKDSQGRHPGNTWPITGKFTRSYSVWDTTSQGKKTTITRTFNFVDNEEPDVTLVGKAAVEVKACQGDDCAAYVDEGARCFDFVGGEMGQSQIVKGGNAVDKSKPGEYIVTYKCKDNAPTPNWSKPVSRIVTVKDTGCPVISVTGANPAVIEANFPYKDAGATAVDDITPSDDLVVTTTGNTVNTKKLYSQARSCQDIKDVVSDANSGRYMITSYTAEKKFFNVQVFCDMTTGMTYSHTSWFSASGQMGPSVVPYGDNAGACAAQGLEMATYPFSAVATEEFAKLSKDFALNKENPTNSYLCSTTKTATAATHSTIAQAHLAGARAEPGKYIITYRTKDAAGNTDTSCGAAPSTREVTVQDTLPPVISLHMGGKLLKSSNAADTANPAWDADQNPFLNDGYFDAKTALMAEQSTTSANGWILAAAASAVAGVALLAASKRTVATSVPV
jgi:hypothetical protein